MNHLSLLFAFIAAISLLTITPGVDTAVVLRAATAEGRRPAAMAPLTRFLHRAAAVKMLDRVTGGIFIAFGIKLATSSAH